MRPSQVTQALEYLIKAKQPVMLHGSPGVGKSQVVKQVADKLGIEMIDLRLSQLDPVDLRADREQIGTVYAKGDAGAQRIDVAERSRRRRRVGGDTANQPVELAQARRWQLMKQCDVGAKLIAFGREMRGTQRVEVALVRRTHRRGHDDGCGASGLDGRGEARASYLKPPR